MPAKLKLPDKLVVREPLKTVPKHLLRAVGAIVVAHTRLELLVTELVYDILRLDYMLGRQILRGDSTPENFKLARRILNVWGVNPPENLQRLSKDIEKAYSIRNEIAHGAWVRIKRRDIRLRLAKEKRGAGVVDRRILPEFAKRPLSKFKSDTQFINGVTARIRNLQKHVRIELRPWPMINVSRPPKNLSSPH